MNDKITEDHLFQLTKIDSEALGLLKALALTNESLTLDDLPLGEFETINSNLFRLYEFAIFNWITVKEKMILNDYMLKEFSISERGKKVFNKLQPQYNKISQEGHLKNNNV